MHERWNYSEKNLKKETVMRESVISALKRVSKIVVACSGDAHKGDLILLGTNAGLTDQDLSMNFPELYRAEEIETEISETELDENENESEVMDEDPDDHDPDVQRARLEEEEAAKINAATENTENN